MQQAGWKIELLFPRGIKLGNSQLLVCEILQLQRTVWTKWYLRSGQSSKLHLPSLEDLSDKPLVLQNKKCWKVGTSGCSSKDLSTSTHASVLLGKYCYMERFCFKHIHFLYNEEHFSLWKINELTFFFLFACESPWRNTREGHKHSSEKHSHPETACVGIMKMLWASARWGAEAVLFEQVTEETIRAAADEWWSQNHSWGEEHLIRHQGGNAANEL